MKQLFFPMGILHDADIAILKERGTLVTELPMQWNEIHKLNQALHSLEPRDYFAGQALIGFLNHYGAKTTEEEAAFHSYKQADAMLKEREKANK